MFNEDGRALSGVALVVVLFAAGVVPACRVTHVADLRVQAQWGTACETQAHFELLQPDDGGHGSPISRRPR